MLLKLHFLTRDLASSERLKKKGAGFDSDTAAYTSSVSGCWREERAGVVEFITGDKPKGPVLTALSAVCVDFRRPVSLFAALFMPDSCCMISATIWDGAKRSDDCGFVKAPTPTAAAADDDEAATVVSLYLKWLGST